MESVTRSPYQYENAVPNPEYLIKSIAEQGYSLETALADLIDNSISAGADCIEILVDTDSIPFRLFIADNGNGMNSEGLSKSLRFPSSSMELTRDQNDLGRFGLGLKTASFSQTRKFTVLSRTQNNEEFAGRTWDVDHLKKVNAWQILINSTREIEHCLESHSYLSQTHFNAFRDFRAGTIVIWEGLYKYENHTSEKVRKDSLKHQITEVTAEYLSIVFHRFLQRKNNPIKIRINGNRLKPFDPFPESQTDLRSIQSSYKALLSDVIKFEGFILPVKSIDESKEKSNVWTPASRSLMDMEGLYIYRADRLIYFGGWNNLIKKSPRLQLARLKIDIGNGADAILHLNVAKSQVAIPFDLKRGFLNYIIELRNEAEREYYNRGITKIISRSTPDATPLFEKRMSSKGVVIELNQNYPLIQFIQSNVDQNVSKAFSVLTRIINTNINKIRAGSDDQKFEIVEEADGTLEKTVEALLSSGLNKKDIFNFILPDLGYRQDAIPNYIVQLLS